MLSHLPILERGFSRLGCATERKGACLLCLNPTPRTKPFPPEKLLGANHVLDFHECCDFAPRVYAAHPDLASSSPRPKALWLVTGSEVSKQGIFFTVLGGEG